MNVFCSVHGLAYVFSRPTCLTIPVCREHGTACSTVNQPATAESATYASRASVCEGRVDLGSIALQHGREKVDKAPSLSHTIDLTVHPGRVESS